MMKIRRTEGERRYLMRQIGMAELEQVVALHNEVIDKLPDADLCWRFPLENIRRYLALGNVTVGVFDEERLIAFRVLYFPDFNDDNPGLDFGLVGSELKLVAHLPLSNVHPDFTGNGLQKKMTLYAIELAAELRPFRYLCSNVSPKNYPSMAEKFAIGMLVVKLKEKYGGFRRYVFCKDLQSRWHGAEKTKVFAATQDYQLQEELLERGYRGFKAGTENGIKGVYFAKSEADSAK